MRPLFLCLAIASAAAGTGCQHDVQLHTLDAEGRYDRALSEARAVALESNGRRRILFQTTGPDGEGVLGGESLLLYLSFKIDPVHGVDLRHPKVFVSLRDVAVSFSGFLDAESMKGESGPKGETVSGRFTGTLRAQGSGKTRNVTIALDKAPVTEVRTREEFDRKGYADVIRQHLYSLEFDAQDREYWRAPDAPTPITPPAAGAPSPHEHN